MLDNKEFEFDNKKSFSKFVKLFSFKTVLENNFVSEIISKGDKEMTFTARVKKDKESLSFRLETKEEIEKEEENIGWKIHVSIDDTVKKNIGKLWNLIYPIAIKHELRLIKLVMVEDKEQKEGYSKGRHLTIYANLNKDFGKEKWKEVLEEINISLVEYNIKPGIKNSACKAFEGSDYFSYRNATKPVTEFKTENYIHFGDENESKSSSEDTLDKKSFNVPKTEKKEFKGMDELKKVPITIKEKEPKLKEEEILYISTEQAFEKYGEKSYNPSEEQDIFEGLILPEIVDENNCQECCKKCTIF